MSQRGKHIDQVVKRKLLLSVGAILIVIVGLVLLNSMLSFRLDLTEEKRFSLHEATKNVLANLEEPLEVDILLTGNLPGGMRRFQKNIEETLETFNAYSSKKISIRYFDPLEIKVENEQEEYILYLAEFGINPTNLFANNNGSQTSRLIFPGVVIRNAEYETGGLLLKGENGMSPEQILNLSIENLEYELISMIEKLVSADKQAIAMITNHGELQDDEGYGIVEALSAEYEVYKVPLEQAKTVDDLMVFDAIIIAGPKANFKEREIYLMDQYVMRGGNVLFCIDPLAVDMENAGGEGTVALAYETGLDQLLFKYGVRINKDLIQDMNFGYYPVVAGDFGNQPQITPLPWPFYVIATNMSDHVITKGLDQMKFRFVSSLDTVKAEGVRKTPLVFSGDYSRTLAQPVNVAFKDMMQEPDISLFSQKYLPLVYLLEGNFTSYFKNRFLPEEFKGDGKFTDSGSGNVVVVGDGDWIQGVRNVQTGEPLAIGIDPFSDVSVSNKVFLENTLKYLLDPNGIMVTRSKELKIRPLNKKLVEEEKLKWQLINIALPIVLIMMLGSVKVYWRKRKFGSKN
ncbi:gliding motility-associated ABC transporter substrate-binding protein GldG [Echinicola sp. CAU 1574]|uniref:Gliding motility-associated ABC transporter substrate-binding protein GldG n=1 Tax=Echinicola arenosa TaxID=2774144 RepID=A0ABR9AQK5_9BACT|nr:gliding motility-associated ABC transporter substrate-binding protein GldG [Echinicola arenosa]MBD8490220.1 gliding motility-associated ABC transporter substrate-binding protein GldG [Echinicola arenosa]